MKNRPGNLIISINSLAFFMLAYLVLVLVQQFTYVIAASMFDFGIIVFHDKIQFITESYSWTQDAVKTIFSAAPLIFLIYGTLSLIIYHKAKEFSGQLKQFFLWTYLLAYSSVFGSILIGAFANTGFGHVLNWSYVMDTGRMLHAIIAIVGLGLTGIISPRAVLLCANIYYNNLADQSRRKFIHYQLLIPALSGLLLIAIMIVPFGTDYEFYNLLNFMSVLIPVLIIMLRTLYYPALFFDEDKKEIKIAWNAVLLGGLILIVYRIIFSFGIKF